MKNLEAAPETFPKWHHDFKTTLTKTGNFINALVAEAPEISFVPSTKVPSETIKAISHWLVDRSPIKLDLSCNFPTEMDFLAIIASLDKDRLEYLELNCTTASIEVLTAIVDFVATANAQHMKLKVLGLNSLSMDNRTLKCQQLNRLFNLQYCPAIILRWSNFVERDFEALDFGNCQKLTLTQHNWSIGDFAGFLSCLHKSRITHLHIGVLKTDVAIRLLVSALPLTKVIALRLVLHGTSSIYEDGICQILQSPKLKYLSMTRCNFTTAVYETIKSCRLRYIGVDGLSIKIYPTQLFYDNIKLCGFNDSSVETQFYQRNMLIQATIRHCAYTLLLIKRFRPESVFQHLDINVVKIIASMLLDSSHELVWLEAVPK